MRPESTSHNPVLAYWNGEREAWRAFWFLGIGLSVIIGLIGVILIKSDPSLKLYFLLAVTLLPVTVWRVVAIWRCAGNASKVIWKILIRAYVIFLGFMTLREFVQLLLSLG